MKKQLTALLVIAISLMIAGSALAFTCADEAITCDGSILSGTIGIPPQQTFPPCNETTGYNHKVYNLSLATAQEITVTVSGPPTGSMQIIVFENCDETTCLARTAVGAGTLNLCLPAGQYTVALSYLIEAIMPSEISMTCLDCIPVPVEIPTFGSIKSYYR